MSFDDWMQRINDILDDKYGLSTSDLPDQPYRDWFDAGVEPDIAAEQAVEELA